MNARQTPQPDAQPRHDEAARDPTLRRLRQVILRDLESGAAQPLAGYQALFPDHAELVAAQYHRMLAELSVSRAGGAFEAALDLDPAVPAVIGRYHVGPQIGRGGQGIVYLAHDPDLDRDVALKVLPRAGRPADALARFLRAARLAARLDHPNICAIHDVGLTDELAWIAMRHVPGHTLAALIDAARERGDRLPALPPLPATASDRERVHALLAAFERTALALQTAHAAGFVHRDVKPANIMITDGGEPVLLDFGLARLALAEETTLTREGTLIGTPSYMSPEQIRGESGASSALDWRTDVYSLGATLYESLTLRRPFDAPTTAGLCFEILTGEVDYPAASRGVVAGDLRMVIGCAMARDRAERYASAGLFADDLQRVREQRPIIARPERVIRRIARLVRRHPRVSAALLALILALAAGLGTSLAMLRGLRTALMREQRAATARDAALDRFTQASVVHRAQQLLRALDRDLLPLGPEQIPALRNWIATAEALLRERERVLAARQALAPLAEPRTDDDRHRDHLEGWWETPELFEQVGEIDAFLTAQDQPQTIDAGRITPPRLPLLLDPWRAALADALADERVAEPRSQRFERADLSWIATMLDNAEVVLNAIDQALLRARAALHTCESFAARPAEWQERWDICLRDLHGDPRFAGVEVPPQFDLLPLWRHPQTGLWEFAVLTTGDPPVFDATRNEATIDAATGIVVVLLPGGLTLIGAQSADPAAPLFAPHAPESDGPVQHVRLDPFYIGKHCITQAQWERAMRSNPCHARSGVDLYHAVDFAVLPVENVNWREAMEFGRRTRLTLPTQAQWEYACRAGTTTAWWTGDDPPSLHGAANLFDQAIVRSVTTSLAFREIAPFDDGYEAAAPVFAGRANPFGLFEVHGNVAEWCLDPSPGRFWDLARDGDGLRPAADTSVRAIRGGSMSQGPDYARSGFAMGQEPGYRTFWLGFRVARPLDAPSAEPWMRKPTTRR